ncbi:Hypothetical predicted protein [Mytilus galloprovincialis]|uniref:B box-type domain-containing protein n=1 Tax=Mytilus galloprovincialis TaxID=29158 RepID=A0A8B6GJC7_MYTGA|nr:Hypothetical predicted protein [Mytilus galloprovincialis]
MSSVQERKFFRLLKLSFDLSLNVIRAFMETNVLTIHYANLDDFLNKHKHAIYHLWEQVQCCDCVNKKNQEKLKRMLNEKQIKLLLTKTDDYVKGHIMYRDRRIHQVCICRFKIVDNCSIKSLDITLLHCLLNNFAVLKNDERTWINKIKDIRNNLAHVTSIKEFDVGRLQKWWDDLVGAILGLASKMPFTTYAVMVEDQIGLLKKADLDTEDVEQILIDLQKENGELMMTFWKRIQTQLEQDKTEILSTTENLLQKFSTEQREELQRFYDMILQCSNKPIHETIDHGKDAEHADFEQSGANTSAHFRTGHESDGQVQSNGSTKETQLEQANVCKVEWKIVTPGSWNVDIIADKLNLLSATIKELIQIEFVKTGSLTIHTTMPIHLFNDRVVLRQAITSFLKRILEINEIDTNERSIIPVSMIMTEQYELQQTKYMDDEEVICFRDYEDINAHIQLLLSDSSLCRVHKNQELVRFCGTHDNLLCEVCENNSHLNCSGLISIEKAAASVSYCQAVSDLAHKVRNVTEAMTSVISNDKTNISSIERQVKWIKNIKDDYKKMIYAHIRQLEASFLEEM